MKNQLKLTFIYLFICLCHSAANGQSQLKHWYISPYEINVTSSSPAVIPMLGTPPPARQISNGIYDLNGDLLFYTTVDASQNYLEVYDRNNNLMGSVGLFYQGVTSEISIVPAYGNDGCSNNKYYIFTAGTSPVGSVGCTGSEGILNESIIDMNLNSGMGGIASNFVQVDAICGYENSGIAVGKLHGDQRYIYFSGTNSNIHGQIDKLILDASGNVSLSSSFATPTFANFQTQEMDLSPNGDYLAFANIHSSTLGAGYRYYIIGLDGNGNFINNSYQQFNLNDDPLNQQEEGGRGVEFYQSGSITKLFIGGGGLGIYSVDIPNVAIQVAVSGSANYGFSQLEMANNNYIYAGSSDDIGAIDPAPSFPVMVPGSNINTVATIIPGSLYPFYCLPDQIDGENYDNIIPAQVTFDVTSVG